MEIHDRYIHTYTHVHTHTQSTQLGPSYLVVVVPREPSSTTAGVAAVADGGGAANGNPKMGAYTHPTNNNNKENQPTAEDDVGNGQSQALMTLDTLVEQQPTDKQACTLFMHCMYALDKCLCSMHVEQTVLFVYVCLLLVCCLLMCVVVVCHSTHTPTPNTLATPTMRHT